jgi:hypothetical protein
MSKYWREGYHSFALSKKIIIMLGLSGAILLALGLTYFSYHMIRLSPAEIKLAALAYAINQKKPCHETCAAERHQATQIIIDDLKNNHNNRTARRVEKYFLAGEIGEEFKQELVKIIGRAYGADNPPDYIKTYFKQADAVPALEAAILGIFSPRALNLDDEHENTATSSLAAYFSLLNSQSDLVLKLAAVENLSNEEDKIKNFSLDQLNQLREIILQPTTPSRLRQSLVMLLSDYFSLFPQATAVILHDVYDSDMTDDIISRAFSADILNREAGEKLAMPIISPEAWAEYYND